MRYTRHTRLLGLVLVTHACGVTAPVPTTAHITRHGVYVQCYADSTCPSFPELEMLHDRVIAGMHEFDPREFTLDALHQAAENWTLVLYNRASPAVCGHTGACLRADSAIKSATMHMQFEHACGIAWSSYVHELIHFFLFAIPNSYFDPSSVESHRDGHPPAFFEFYAWGNSVEWEVERDTRLRIPCAEDVQ